MDDVTKTDKMLSRKDGNVGYVIFNNPERHNAVSLEMWSRTAEILAEFARDDDVRVVVITGAGGKSFVSGADISKFESERASQDATKIYNAAVAKANESIYEFAKPTIAMINGPAAGAGLALTLACDLRVAGTSARLVTAFVRVGFSGDFGGSFFLTRLVGTAKARELYFTGRPVEADEALSLRLVNRVVADEDLVSATMELARSLARGPSIALSLMKRNLNCAETGDLTELLDMEAVHQVQTGRTEDHREAAKAFVEKRAPIFTGR